MKESRINGTHHPVEPEDSIRLTGLRIPAFHGVFDHERQQGQIFVVDVTVRLDLAEAGRTDRLDTTIDYGALAHRIHHLVSEERWNLIERVAERVAEMVLEDDLVARVEVTIHKPEAPIEADFADVAVTLVRYRPSLAAIALGSNRGDRSAHLLKALEGIKSLGRLMACSDVYETEPIGLTEQNAFFNAVVLVETRLAPAGLLDRLLQIEQDMGRQRTRRWGPRIIDLDLILHGSTILSGPSVEVPHPRYRQRRFVLQPLVEVWPNASDPDGTRIAELLDAVSDQVINKVEVSGWPVH
ncbi:MAG: 2-amino-4-hydroxy-6-hydroxymethyldihydropteridine diphosphokinase [Acidimicrobiia bacterium]|nr:2-amino-4-hydroxy-6-hydroxymethyldihydropteridine diphosphokinase [Acidimicrobiia bacterium]MXZ07726.1 2-amino-4-hydroxy-6-hydroxymethyldihydropteridine diphosphokinase [Acidimicrobiia bacterium]MYD03869.1 2-amino-4-hydroxy-6-hydroxymethyldihydropteridine diphosphokinase [Acidimicrobiia bacterium]MYF26085.1 2-amino-4-hydroxy-6-hydroxymethyldihydropteridine diphosphokinase [Acidimicrobiia bacterium]